MKASVSIPVAAAYGSDEVVPTKPQGLTVEDAIYHTVHGHAGGAAALSARMGMSQNTLLHKSNPNNSTHFFHPRELVTLQHMSGNAAVLHAMADALGYTCTRATPDQSGGDPVEAFMRLQCEFADLVRALADPMADGSAVNRNEMRRAEHHAAELQAAIGHAIAAMRGRMRQAPEAF